MNDEEKPLADALYYAWAIVIFCLPLWFIRVAGSFWQVGQVPNLELIAFDGLLVGLHTLSLWNLARAQREDFLNRKRFSSVLSFPWVVGAFLLARDISLFWHDRPL